MSKKPFVKAGKRTPRRFKSAFIIYSASRHNDLRRELELQGVVQKKTTGIAKLLSAEWQNMTAAEKEPWEAKSRDDKARYDTEKESFLAAGGNKRKRILKDETAPKRPTSAYLLYSNQRRAEMKRQHPSASNGEVSRLLSQKWKSATDEEKSEYLAVAARSQEDYKTELAKWKKTKAAETKANRKKERAEAVLALEADIHETRSGEVDSKPPATEAPAAPVSTSSSLLSPTVGHQSHPEEIFTVPRRASATGSSQQVRGEPEQTNMSLLPAPLQGMGCAPRFAGEGDVLGNERAGATAAAAVAAVVGEGGSMRTIRNSENDEFLAAMSRAGLPTPLVNGDYGNNSTAAAALGLPVQQAQLPLHQGVQASGGAIPSGQLSDLQVLLGQQQLGGFHNLSAATTSHPQVGAATLVAASRLADQQQFHLSRELGLGGVVGHQGPVIDSSYLTALSQHQMRQRQLLVANHLQPQVNQANALPSLLLERQELLGGGSGALRTNAGSLLAGGTLVGSNAAAAAARLLSSSSTQDLGNKIFDDTNNNN